MCLAFNPRILASNAGQWAASTGISDHLCGNIS
jgi:hypothetical protein